MPITSGEVQAKAEHTLKVGEVSNYVIPCANCERDLIFDRLECVDVLRRLQEGQIQDGCKTFDSDEDKWTEIEQSFIAKEALLEVSGKVDVHPLTMLDKRQDQDNEKKHVHICRKCGEVNGYKMGGEYE